MNRWDVWTSEFAIAQLGLRGSVGRNSWLCRFIFACFLLLISSSSLWAQTTSISPEQEAFFEKEVRPVLALRCYGCHSSRINDPKAGLKLDSRSAIEEGGDSGPAIDQAHLSDSLLAKAIRREEGYEMPPDGPIPESEKASLLKWIEQGAPWPQESTTPGNFDLNARLKEHWVWKPLSAKVPESASSSTWAWKPADWFIEAGLTQAGLKPNRDATDLAWARRLAIDLTGLSLSQEMLSDYLADRSLDRDQRLVDKLLASPRFGEKWGRHWLDAVRYAETYGHEFDYAIPQAYRYRDYVVKAINEDVSYDRFIREHVAGDLLEDPRVDPVTGENLSAIATGVWWIGQAVHAPVDVKGDRATRVDDQIDTFSKAILGLTVACARCHDHKFDAISTADYYSLLGMFQSSRRHLGWVDQEGKFATHHRQAKQRVAETEAWLINSLNESASDNATETVVDGWRVKEGEAARTIEHPGWLVDQIKIDADPADWEKKWGEVKGAIEKAKQDWDAWQAKSEVVLQRSDFGREGQGVSSWRFSGATEDRMLPSDSAKIDWFTFDKPRLRRPDTLATYQWGKNSPGVWRSPLFHLHKPMLFYRIRGQQALLNASIEDYYMNEVTGLLFGDTRKGLDTGGQWGWVGQGGDLRKYIDHRIFVEIFDDGPGWFELAEIWQADSPPPAEPHPLLVEASRLQVGSPVDVLKWFEGRVNLARRHFQQGKATAEDSLLLQFDSTWFEKRFAADSEKNQAWSSKVAELRSIDQQTPPLGRCLMTIEGTGENSPVFLRGNPKELGDVVSRGDLSATTYSLGNAENGSRERSGSGRNEMADILVASKNPLTSRVVVNRVWAQLFGRGLVDTTDNLGVLGGRPSHPELLDYLSSEMMRRNWSLKNLVRELVLSHSYRLSSEVDSERLAADPSNLWWSYMPVKRLSAEILRDRLLQLGGDLNLTMCGPSVAAHITPEMQGRGRPGSSGPLNGNGRRSVYLEIRRNFPNPLLTAFDLPTPQAPQTKRNQSNVPAQALALLNDPLVYDQCQKWCNRLKAMQLGAEDQLQKMYEESLGRRGETQEVSLMLAYLKDANYSDQAWFDVAHTLLNRKEFLFIR